MKKLIVFSLLSLLFCMVVGAQEHELVGTWIYHYPSYYVDGEDIWPKQDGYLRIDEKDGKWFVSIKRG